MSGMNSIDYYNTAIKLLDKDKDYFKKQKECRMKKENRKFDKKYKDIKNFSPSGLPF